MSHSRNMKMGLLLFLSCVCSLTPISQTQKESPNITDLTFKNMDFAMTLYRQISGSHDNNIFFSPLSISTAFAALSLAADGPTRDEILKGLNLAQLERQSRPQLIPELFQNLTGSITRDGTLKLDQGTAFFVQLGFEVNRTFDDQIKRFFNADINSVDFSDTSASVALINEYIKFKTGNKVTEMITSMDPSTQVMLINTIFFQGEWQTHFNPNHTGNERFYVDSYNIVQVSMMFREDKYHTMEDAALKAKVLRLPYRNGVSMLILLPDKGRDYTTIDDEITAERFLFWIKNLREIKLEVQLPKFKLEQSYDVHHLLQDLGIVSVFGDSANLTRLSREVPIKVSEVLHKAVIEVDEKGTTAAAATTIGFTAYSLPPTFIVNRPFFFFVYHEVTNNLLFMGRVIDPTKH